MTTTTTIDVADLTVDQLRDGLTAAIRATPIGHRTTYQHGPVTIEVYGASRAATDLPDATAEVTVYTPDGRYERRLGDGLTWDALHALVQEMAAEWTAAVETELHELRRRHRALVQAEARVEQLRAARDEVVVRAARLGVLPAHIAAALPGVHRSTVGRILDRVGLGD
jgi:hypothetical protein